MVVKSVTRWKFFESLERLNDAFWKWFGDSRAVNSDGSPTLCYHGSSTTFKIFRPSKSVGNQGETDQIEGIYFTDNRDGASFFALTDDPKYLKSVYLSIKNPYVVVDHKTLRTEIGIDKLADANKKLVSMGYDGIIMERGFFAAGGPHKLFLAFNSNQVKSVDNDGTWDVDDDNIYS